MRLLLFSITIALLAQTVARAGIHDVAPADEYFGPFKESILGIRNHLVDLERKGDAELVMGHARTGIDNIEVAVEDWQRHYPRDTWLPGFFDRIVHVYARAHALQSARARRAVAILERAYPRTWQARDAVALLSHRR